MRKSIVIAVSLLFVVASAFAQEHATPANTFSVFLADPTLFHTSSGTNLDAAYGAAFDHMFSRHISGELSVTRQPFRRYVTTFSTVGQPSFSNYQDERYPIDANLSYHFLTDSRWKPYLGAGLRYVQDSFVSSGPLGKYHIVRRSADPEISGGVTFQLRPNVGLRLDGKEIAGGGGSFLGHGTFAGSVGLSFRF
jgi:outer membrane protein W